MARKKVAAKRPAHRVPISQGGRTWGMTRQRDNKQWQASYPDPHRTTYLTAGGNEKVVRHYAEVRFDTKQDAEAWLLDEKRLIDSGQWTPPEERRQARIASTLTFSEYATTWLDDRRVRGKPLADRTRSGYEWLLRDHINPAFGDGPLNRIIDSDVDLWYVRLAPGRDKTRADAYGLFRSIMKTAEERNLITSNPAKVRGGGNAETKHREKPATLTELAAMVARMPEQRRMMVQLAAWCSLRFGELTELRRHDIDLTKRLIHVQRGVVWVKGKPKVKEPKTKAGIRPVPIPPHIVNDLKTHLKSHAQPGPIGLLFPAATGNHLRPSAFYGRASELDKTGDIRRRGYGWHEARRVAGRPTLHFHDLRVTGLTNAAIAGATLGELMELAGHSTPGAAMRYQRAVPDRMQDLAARLSALAKTNTETPDEDQTSSDG